MIRANADIQAILFYLLYFAGKCTPVTVNVGPDTVVVYAPDEALLTCNFTTASTIPSAHWYKLDVSDSIPIIEDTGSGFVPLAGWDRLSVSGDLDGRVINLMIEDTIVSDSGEYRCRVFGRPEPSDEGSIILTVNKILNYVHIVTDNEGGKVGQESVYNCSAPNVKPAATLTWYIDGKPTSARFEERIQNDDGTFNSISVLEVTPNITHSGKNIEISCEAYQEDSATRITSSAYLQVQGSKETVNIQAAVGGAVGCAAATMVIVIVMICYLPHCRPVKETCVPSGNRRQDVGDKGSSAETPNQSMDVNSGTLS